MGKTRAAQNDELSGTKVAEWNLPTDGEEFVRWLRASGISGISDRERLQKFLDNPVSKLMPDALEADLEALGIL